MEVPYRLISIANVFSDFSCDAFHLNYTYILRLIVNIFMNNLLPFQAKHICLLHLHYLSLDLTQIGKLLHLISPGSYKNNVLPQNACRFFSAR